MSSISLRKGIKYLMIPMPVLDEINSLGSLVYGAVFRHANMYDGMCYASQKTIAKMAHVSLRTTNQNLGKLVESDYLRLGKNPIPNMPNIYFITSKSGAEGVNVIDVSKEESKQEPERYELNKVFESINNKKVVDPNYMNYGDM